MLDRADIERMLPHSGKMVLLDRVAEWDRNSILCAATSHRESDNPLRRDGVLSAVCGVEYAAQAAALHAVLADPGQAGRPAYLGAVKSVRAGRLRLDDLEGEIAVRVELENAQTNGAIYSFRISAADFPDVLTGRLTVMYG